MKNKKIIFLSLLALLSACGQNTISSSQSSSVPSTKTSSSINNVITNSSSSKKDELTLELRVKSFDVVEVLGINNKIQIPDYSATDKLGNDITNLVQITDSLASDIDLNKKIITLLEPGEHKIVFRVTDPNDETLTESKEFTITCFRDLINFDNMHSETYLKDSKENQYVVSHNPDKGLARLNMDSGKLYYAEAEFDGTVDKDVCKGLSHVISVDNDKGTPVNHWVTSMINVDTKEHIIINSKNYSWTEVSRKNISESIDLTEGFKFAIARYGNTMYSFINDVLIETYTHDVLTNVDTTPALYTYMGGAFEEITIGNEDGTSEVIKKNLFAETGIKISKIDYYNDTKAFKKLQELNVGDIQDTMFELSQNKLCVELNSRVKLPSVIAYNKGKNLLNTLKIYDVDNNQLDLNGTYVGSEKGKYVFTFKVYDEVEDIYLSEQLVIDVIDVIFAEKNTNYMTLELSEDNTLNIVQNGHNSNSGSYEGDVETYQHYAIGSFNLSPSKLYYAEATIDTHNTFANGGDWNGDGNTLFGMAHVDSLSLGRKQGNNFITSGVRGYNRSLVMNKFINNEKKNPSSDDSSIAYIEDFVSTLKWNASEFKIAIARNGETLYTFINDEYVASVYDKEYAAKDTLPGVFSTSFNSHSIETKFRNVNFYDGSLAEEKINNLLGDGKNLLIPNYMKTRNNSSKWSVNDISEENGISVDILTSDVTHDQSCFTNSIRYNGDFKIEWDFTPLEANTASDEQGESSVILNGFSNVRGSTVASIHTRFKAKTLTLDRFAIQADITKSWGDQVVEDYDVSKGMHYVIESTLNGNKRTFTFTVNSISNPELINTRTIELTNGDQIPGSESTVTGMDGVIVFRFSTRNLKARYSNFKWTGFN